MEEKDYMHRIIEGCSYWLHLHQYIRFRRNRDEEKNSKRGIDSGINGSDRM